MPAFLNAMVVSVASAQAINSILRRNHIVAFATQRKLRK
jgi:hypothetical protein